MEELDFTALIKLVFLREMRAAEIVKIKGSLGFHMPQGVPAHFCGSKMQIGALQGTEG